MGWIIGFAILLAGLILHNDAMIITSGLFAIAGSGEVIATKLQKLVDLKNELQKINK